MNSTKELVTSEQVTFALNITHDEYLENVIEGRDEKYQEWAEHAAWMIAKILIPAPRQEQ